MYHYPLEQQHQLSMTQSRKKKKYATMTNTNEKTLLAPILGTQVTHRIEPHKFIVNASETVYVPSMAKSKFKNGNLRENFGSGTTGITSPKNNHPPSLEISKNSGGSPVEQTTEQDQNHENHDDEAPQQVNEENDNNTQKTQKDTNTSTDNDIQKTPENSQNTPSQEEPINTRGEKYNLRPNPNPNYFDTYRY